MSDSESGGEHTNAEYYKHIWTKPPKVTSEPKTAKVKLKRHGEAMFRALPENRKGKIVRRKAVRPPPPPNR